MEDNPGRTDTTRPDRLDALFSSNPAHLEALAGTSPGKPGPEGRAAAPADFGWRLRGQAVGVLPDQSFSLQPTRHPAAQILLSRFCADTQTLESCLQCGACTAMCNLAEEGSLFPRRQMTMVQFGQRASLLADPAVWLCYNCADCSASCPAKARPGRVMAAVRQMAVEHYATPRFVGKLMNDARGLLWVLLVPALLLLAAIAVGGSFRPETNPVRYASMLPHLTLNLFFFAATSLAATVVLLGAARAWRAFSGTSLWRADWRLLVGALARSVSEAARHRRFTECEQYPLSRWAHFGVFYGFLVLFALAGVVAAMLFFGVPYPFPALHPLKVVGNLAGASLIGGVVYFLLQRRQSAREGDRSSWFDWALLLDLLLVSVSGLLTEVFRFTGPAVVAYPVYFLHLLFVLVLLAGLPYSKLAHVVYRMLALIAREYLAAVVRKQDHLKNHHVA